MYCCISYSDEYLRFFPSGSHLADAHDRWVSAIAYDMEQGVIALEKRVKEREYEENKWKGYGYCTMVITTIECIDQDDYMGSDRLWIFSSPRSDLDRIEADINISSGEKKTLDLIVQLIYDCQGYAYFYIEEVDIFGYGEINDEIARVNEHISEFNPRTEYIREFKNEDEGIHYKIGFKIIPYE